jgi:hypothetical protein
VNKKKYDAHREVYHWTGGFQKRVQPDIRECKLRPRRDLRNRPTLGKKQCFTVCLVLRIFLLPAQLQNMAAGFGVGLG